MRTYESGARPSRTLAALIEEALAVVRQDLGEYGYIGLVGAFAASAIALVLRIIGGPLALALIALIVSLIAVFTLATCAAALERVNRSLQPDSARSFGEAVIRAPWLLARWIAPAIGIAAAVYVCAAFGDRLGFFPALVIAAVLVVSALHLATPLAMYVPALFARGMTAKAAAAHTDAIMRAGRFAILIAWAIALLPAELAALFAVAAGFGSFSTTLFAFAAVMSMPLVASLMSLIYTDAAMQFEERAAIEPSTRQAPAIAARLDRHIR